MMKNTYRFIVVLLLIAILTIVLIKNKKAVQFEVDSSKTTIDSIPVGIYNLKSDSASYNLQTVGKVRSANEVYVVSQTPGEIKNVPVKIGEEVRMGDIIAQVDDYYARQEYDMSEKAFGQFSKDYERYSDLAKLNAVTKQQLEQMRLQMEGAETKMNSLKKRLNDFNIKAPVSGIINQLFVSKGNMTGAGTPVCEIIGGKSVKIEAKINPEQANYLHVGLNATMSGEFGHGDSYRIKLAEIGERAGKFGGISAVFTLSQDEKKAPKSGSVVNILIEIPVGPKLLIPRAAITSKDGETGIFVVDADNKVEFKPVRYTDFDDKRISLMGNEISNARIAVEGNYLLKNGDLVKVNN